MSIIETIKKEKKIKISGVMLMYIANVLRERQIVIFKSLADAITSGGDEKAIDHLGGMAMANEIVGQKVMDLIEECIGKELFEKFVDGKIDAEIKSIMPESNTIN